MGVMGIWQANATMLALLIVVNMALSIAGGALWIAVGTLSLLVALFLSFRQGMRLGHDACGVSSTIEGARRAGEQVYAQLDARYLRQAWSRRTGFRGLMASALIPYAASCVYIIMTLVGGEAGALSLPTVIARSIAWVLSIHCWPLILHWHADFVTLTPAIAVMLLASPFLLPALTYLGYLQGPRLWAQTEAAMKAGRRRAKARARVGKSLAPKRQKPEI